MNGLSDVRLTLRAVELEREHCARVTGTPPMPGNRWSRFWMRLHTRRALLALDDRALKDIGLSRAQALEEGRKPFWKS
ncbi:DUF1127 domain-containing protein [Metapseudomonas furukawaii]|jgi:uncharacterized protein YjiS (DUF1127 family)|uniref:YjiS-like domain-containing protein n=1 Tax=Metapseudomonas furukawaii TaxID=1149133 RepID=A0AAD1BVZ5_METFU|nr:MULTISPECIES: DUF1127 domain-containing protein [Pseudomonas]ELS28059.1 hypothetical protein ppKF707_3218 [Pseudomonas furukawaii]OWJ90717.1 hypothetical protein B6S59_26320 [Pseudomonas sp. A46]BAU72030.1 hypothetical protein KF707C_3420 [Pseudomonas furukawaii]